VTRPTVLATFLLVGCYAATEPTPPTPSTPPTPNPVGTFFLASINNASLPVTVSLEGAPAVITAGVLKVDSRRGDTYSAQLRARLSATGVAATVDDTGTWSLPDTIIPYTTPLLLHSHKRGCSDFALLKGYFLQINRDCIEGWKLVYHRFVG